MDKYSSEVSRLEDENIKLEEKVKNMEEEIKNIKRLIEEYKKSEKKNSSKLGFSIFFPFYQMEYFNIEPILSKKFFISFIISLLK